MNETKNLLGVTLIHVESGGVVRIVRRKEDDSGWWVSDGSWHNPAGGLADSVIADRTWVPLATVLADWRRSTAPCPPSPEDRSDLLAMGHWVADCLDEQDHLVFRTVVRNLVEEVETLLDALGPVMELWACDHVPRLGVEIDPECARCTSLGPLRALVVSNFSGDAR